MKCATHNNTDAIGVCLTCGKGVCLNCKIEIADKLYCRVCIEKNLSKAVGTHGTLEDILSPQKTVPTVRPVPIGARTPYLLGVVGCYMAGICIILVGICFIGNLIVQDAIYLTILVFMGIALMVSYILQSLGFFGNYIVYRLPISFVMGVFSILGPALLMVYIVNTGSSHFHFYSDTWALLMLSGVIIYGVSVIIISSGLIASRKITRMKGLYLAGGIIGIVGGCIVTSVFLAPLGFGFFLIGATEFLTGTAFLVDLFNKK